MSTTNDHLADVWRAHVGRTVQWAGPATGPQTGVGGYGTVLGARVCSSSVTGAPLTWVSVDVRSSTGAVRTMQPSELRLVNRLSP